MTRSQVGACALSLVLTASHALASVSIAVTWDGLLHESSAAAVVVPVEAQPVWEGGRIVTYTRVRVERSLAGDLGSGSEAWVRTLGGVVGKVGQLVDGEAVLVPGRPSLLFLRRGPVEQPTTYEVTARGQGQFPLAVDENAAPRLVRSTTVGAVLPPGVPAPAASPRLAAVMVHGRTIDDVARDVAAAWSAAHAR